MTKKTKATVGGVSFTRESLTAALAKCPAKAILAGKGERWSDGWYGYKKTSASPVPLSVIKKIKGRSGFKKDLLIEVIVATVFGDDLPKAAVPLTAEEKAAKRKAEIAEARKFKPPVEPLQDLTEEQARFLSNAVMTHPGGCDTGKKEFIKRLGLPLPPPRASISVVLDVPVDLEDVTKGSYGYKNLSAAAIKRLRDDVAGSLPEGANIRGLQAGTEIRVTE